MALRTIRLDGDEILNKKAKEVKKINDKIKTLVEDMLETMYEANGVGLAAPQVGMLKRVFVVDVSEERDQAMVFINPVIEESEGEQCGPEGCLSIPGKQGEVVRPQRIKIKALDVNGDEFVMEAQDFLARAICHENDHLEGILYTSKAKEVFEV